MSSSNHCIIEVVRDKIAMHALSLCCPTYHDRSIIDSEVIVNACTAGRLKLKRNKFDFNNLMKTKYTADQITTVQYRP